jgi:hypothetical protein
MIALSVISIGLAGGQTQPDLSTTTSFILAKLPTEWSTIVGGYGHEYMADWVMEAPCVLSSTNGEWDTRIYSDSTPIFGGPEATVYLLNIEPRAGLHFENKDMTPQERQAFLKSHVNGLVGDPSRTYFLMGQIRLLDFAKVRLSGIGIETLRVQEWRDDHSAEIEKDSFKMSFDSYEAASRLERAFTNAARLCGATDDPF